MGVVLWFVSLVLTCGASLRCAASVLKFFGSVSGQEGICPDRSTGRLWLLRIGLAALLRPKVIAADWVWMIDHSIQIGQCKCLVILGIRLSEFPEGRPLCHQDMEPIALVPMTHSTKQTVAVCLEEAVARTGVPRAILDDHGADLHGGVEIFRTRHPETSEMYDLKHKAACLLKARLEGDERWKQYATELGQTKFAVQQTELAFLVPPSQRSKARFMNLGGLVAWGTQDPGVGRRSVASGAVGSVGGAGAGQAGLAGGIPRGAGGMVGLPGDDRRGVGPCAAPGVVSGGRVRVGPGDAGPAG